MLFQFLLPSVLVLVLEVASFAAEGVASGRLGGFGFSERRRVWVPGLAREGCECADAEAEGGAAPSPGSDWGCRGVRGSAVVVAEAGGG